MNYNIASCLLFILVVICLIFYMNIPETFTSEQKELFIDKNIKEDFTDAVSNLNNDVNKASILDKTKSATKPESSGDDTTVKLDTPEKLIADSEDLFNMFEKLEDAENLCNKIEERQKDKDLKEEKKIGEAATDELDIQETRIEELKGILKKLQIEKIRSQKINDKCHSNKQRMINTDYNLIKTLRNTRGDIGKDKSVNLNLNVSDSLKKLKGSFKYDFDNNKIKYKMTTPSPAQEKSKVNNVKKPFSKTEVEELKKAVAGSYMVPNKVNFVTKQEIENNYKKCEIDKEKYIDINELQFGICKGCDPNAIKPKISQINKDFK